MAAFFRKKKTIYVITGITLGLIAGFLYWKFIGCTSGTCPLTSKWHTTTLFGGAFGYLIADSIKTDKV
jgi:uncharacterized membrane protein